MVRSFLQSTHMLSWEEVSNKHAERRILICYACGALAPYLRPELRPSLILSIMQQLLQDKDTSVRQAAARNLGLLVSLFQSDDKYGQVRYLDQFNVAKGGRYGV